MSNKGITKQLLLSKNYLVLNKIIVEALGIETAMILSVLADAEEMMSNDDGWFYQTVETLEKHSTLSRYKQDMALKQLRDLKIIEQKNMGVPMTRHFRINYDALTNYFVSHSQTRTQITNKLDCKPFATNKEHTNKEHNKEHIKKDTKKEWFDTFWELYPRKVNKAKAKTSFNNKVTNEETFNLITKDLEKREGFEQWTKDNGKFIPHPTTYLNGDRWLDEYEAKEKRKEIGKVW